MGVRLKLVGSRGLYKDGKCVYLSNHRAWADFFIDMYITEVGGTILLYEQPADPSWTYKKTKTKKTHQTDASSKSPLSCVLE